MHGKTIMAAIFVSALLASLVAGLQVVKVAKANPGSFMQLFGPVDISIQSPQNQTYNLRTLSFNFTIETSIENQPPAQYTLNGQNMVNVPVKVVSTEIKTSWTWSGNGESNQSFRYAWFTAQGSGMLSNLADGTYNLTIQRSGNAAIPIVSANVSFTIDTTLISIQIIEPENKTYSTNIIPLNFNFNEPTSQISYSLDNQPNITISENSTLTGLFSGSRSLTLYANDTAGNIGKSDTFFFGINTLPTPSVSPSPIQQPTLSPTPTAHGIQIEDLLFITVFGLVAFAAVSNVLSYFKRRKRRP